MNKKKGSPKRTLGADPIEDFITEEFLDFLINEAMKCLNERERAVIQGRFGLAGELPKTFEEIGQTLPRRDGSGEIGITAPAVRQAEFKALCKLERQFVHLLHKQGVSLTEILARRVSGSPFLPWFKVP